MANKWVVLIKSAEHGTEHILYDTPKEQIAGVEKLIKSAQQHGAVDTIKRSIIIIPDPYRGNQKIEEFIKAYH